MVLIGIQPFAFRKILILVLALLFLTSAICFADSIYMSLYSRSHGRQLQGVKPVSSISDFGNAPTSLLSPHALDVRLTENSGWALRNSCVFAPPID